MSYVLLYHWYRSGVRGWRRKTKTRWSSWRSPSPLGWTTSSLAHETFWTTHTHPTHAHPTNAHIHERTLTSMNARTHVHSTPMSISANLEIDEVTTCASPLWTHTRTHTLPYEHLDKFRDWWSHHRRLAVDGHVAYHWKNIAVKS